MSKEVKSIRLEEELTDLFKDYSNLLNEMFGYSLSFSNIVSESLSEFLMDSSSSWLSAMKSQSVVDRLPNGKLKKYRFTDKQIERMTDIWERATAIWHINSTENNQDENRTYMTIAEISKLSMEDTVPVSLHISKEAEERLYYLMNKLNYDTYDEVINVLLHYAASSDNADMIYHEINE